MCTYLELSVPLICLIVLLPSEEVRKYGYHSSLPVEQINHLKASPRADPAKNIICPDNTSSNILALFRHIDIRHIDRQTIYVIKVTLWGIVIFQLWKGNLWFHVTRNNIET